MLIDNQPWSDDDSLSIVAEILFRMNDGDDLDFALEDLLFHLPHIHQLYKTTFNNSGNPLVFPTEVSKDYLERIYKNYYDVFHNYLLTKFKKCCCYCGNTNVTNDHYLPSKSYNHLSLNIQNLSFVCDPCNRAKSTYVGNPRLIHSVYDHSFVNLVLYLKLVNINFVRTPHEIKVFFNVTNKNISPSINRMILNQITRLNLQEQLTDNCIDIYPELADRLRASATTLANLQNVIHMKLRSSIQAKKYLISMFYESLLMDIPAMNLLLVV